MTRDPNAQDRAAQQAAQWVTRLDQPTVDTAASAAFDEWMREDARNRDDFADVQALWHSDTLADALRATAEADRAGADRGAGQGLRRVAPWLGIAACAVLALFLLLPSLLTTTYRTGRGAGEHIALSDGTQVALSGEAELRVRMWPWRRDVTLAQGEAFFDVTHDPHRPFEVRSGNASVRVLGTAFNVDRQSDSRTVVEVYRGAVAVEAAAASPLVLKKGQQTRILGKDVVAPAQPRSGAAQTPDWTTGWFEANDVPLSVLIAKVQRHARQTIRIESAEVADLPVSGRFRIAEPDRALRAIEAAYGLEARRADDAIILSIPGENRI
ncbi:FecR family protein [Sphingomonas sp. IW22]|uniref:FecR family protein n=1 Tax=Sphingomonas sp. IW22 TaxID=3242489 RepID=UPI003522746B